MPPTPYARLQAGAATLTFLHGDCEALLASLDEGSVSAVVTSPPYNLGVRYRSYRDTLPRATYLEWTGRWVSAVGRVLDPAGSLFLNVGSTPRDPWTALDIAQAVRSHLTLQNTLHWVKSITIDAEAAGNASRPSRSLAVGHYKPINSARYVNDCHEFIFHFTPRGDTPLDRLAIGVPYQDASNIGRWKKAGQGRRCRGNTWFIPYETIQSREKERPHPATFPARLPEYCLRLHGVDRLMLVVDPFLGLGSTAVACARLGVNFVGMELDEAYLDEALARTRDAISEAADLSSPPTPTSG